MLLPGIKGMSPAVIAVNALPSPAYAPASSGTLTVS
jgi:hypothetical protein